MGKKQILIVFLPLIIATILSVLLPLVNPSLPFRIHLYFLGLTSIWSFIIALHATLLLNKRNNHLKVYNVFVFWTIVKMASAGFLFLYLKKAYPGVKIVPLVTEFIILYFLSLVYEVFVLYAKPEK